MNDLIFMEIGYKFGWPNILIITGIDFHRDLHPRTILP
nr:MAG TPA: Rhoptry kinase family protein kinase, kinase, membrane, TRANSFERASE [Bacteriophage sp.]